ncbi:MAG: hypothetical protein HY836_13590 [Aquabacterium sp.]|uniref:hypothetical protein n=1 Tax=Aquabacterium sp. TaxID=1872578 RepID=UPI0025C5A5B2|nr:hypothetical protein [Aquabacterium sp.]MBI5926619.1 hypothetical protein [Aquabacterium sp.]
MALTIWGMKRTDKMGVMDSDDFLAFVVSKVGQGSVTWVKNVNKAFEAISNHVGETGANDKFPYKGSGVCHVSEGKRSSSEGVSVFFTAKGGQLANVIGIGYHIGSSSYKLEWQMDGWETQSKDITL